MSVKKRIMAIKLIEKLDNNPEFKEKLKIETVIEKKIKTTGGSKHGMV